MCPTRPELSAGMVELALAAASAAANALVGLQHTVRTAGFSCKENHRSILTRADLEAERIVLEILRSTADPWAIISEESPAGQLTGGMVWIVDPLDGTSAYWHGLDTYAVSIAAWHDFRPVVGVVTLPALGVTYHAVAGEGAYRNGVRLRVSGATTLDTAMLSLGASVVRMLAGDAAGQRPRSEISSAVRDAQSVRFGGSCAYELALVAEGKADGFCALDQRVWDLAAGILLVTEAGGEVVLDSGTVRTKLKSDLIATNGHLNPFPLWRSMLNPPSPQGPASG